MTKISQALLYLVVFLTIVVLLEYVYFKDIYLVVKNEGNKFNFKNFVIFNVSFKIIGYIIKFGLFYAFFKFILYVADIKEEVSIFKTLVISETVYLICTKAFLVIYFFFIDDSIGLSFLRNFESSASLKFFFSDAVANSDFGPLLSFVTLFDLIYISVLVFLFNIDLKIGFLKVFKIVGLSYIALLFLISAINTYFSINL